jgi:enoyl-CoA hydratase/carnithine racemase
MLNLSRRDHPLADGCDGRVAVITLSRPPVNAIDDVMIETFHRLLDELALQPDWRVLHIRSDQKVFAAGADLSLIRSWKDATSPSGALRGYVERLQSLYQRIESLPQVTFCEIGGAAMGGGFELALSCDLRMAAQEAKLGLPEVGIGLIPGAGGTQRLTRLCGRGVASRVILGCEPIDGTTAASLGMVEWAVPRARIEEDARIVTDRISGLPEHSQRLAKRCIDAFGKAAPDGFQLEREAGSELLDTPRTQQLIGAFLDKNLRK